jgi:hypothetical protein
MAYGIMIRLKSGKMKKPVRTKMSEDRKKKKKYLKQLDKPDAGSGQPANICGNFSCRMRKAGCRGFEGCPGYLAK